MNQNEVIKLNDQVIEAWNNHNSEKFLSLCDENVIWKINGGTETYRGKKEVKEYFDMWKTAFPDFNLKIRSKTALEDAIVAEYEFSGTQKGKLHIKKDMPDIPPKNKPLHNFGCYITKVKNGKVVETNLYLDQLSIVEQLGIQKELLQHS
ncbi:MAG TPA: ester cyclase [Ferruginibacter sp.]|nr:ester cyclase [Ferruginibacter sp.]